MITTRPRFITALAVSVVSLFPTIALSVQLAPSPNPPNNTIEVFGDYENAQSFQNQGDIIIGSESLQIVGRLDNLGFLNNLGLVSIELGLLQNFDSIDNRGTVTNGASGTLNNFNALFNDAGGIWDNFGLMLNDTGATLNNFGVWTNRPGGTFTNVGLVTSGTSGTLNNAGTFINNGLFDASVGNFTNTGTLGGIGTHTGNLNDSGEIAPGQSVGVYTINGDWTKSAGTLTIELSGLSDGGGDKILTEYDWLDITGNLNITGPAQIDLSLLPTFDTGTLVGTERFDIVRFGGSLTGFVNLTLDDAAAPLPDGLGWGLSSDAQAIYLEVILTALAGDLNGDGFVGIDDLNIVLINWNQNVTPGDLLAGDPTGEGFVGVDDLNIVLVNWNNGTPPGAPGEGVVIPEPGTLAMLGLGAVCLIRTRAV